MDKLIAHSHDSLFKIFMQDKQVALEFMEIYLPTEIKTICDLNTLNLESALLLNRLLNKNLMIFYIQ